ncbi:MAG: hypothetical protein JWM58_1258 [Rhizobium sp.]|nr:hypothetical protein [Rhizobium sp.]
MDSQVLHKLAGFFILSNALITINESELSNIVLEYDQSDCLLPFAISTIVEKPV